MSVIATPATVAVILPYFKQGDDCAAALAASGSASAAFVRQAQMLEAAATQLRRLAAHVAGQDVTVDASTHWIGLSGPPALLSQLVAEELAQPQDDQDEDEDEDEDDDYDYDADDEDEDDDEDE